MNKYGLISNYTVKQYKIHKSKCNEEKVNNIVDREFNVSVKSFTLTINV